MKSDFPDPLLSAIMTVQLWGMKKALHDVVYERTEEWGAKVDIQALLVASRPSGRSACVPCAPNDRSAHEGDLSFKNMFGTISVSVGLQDPVILPDSNITVDRATIERHLMSSKTDPFNRSPLSLDMIKPDTELKVRVIRFSKFALVRLETLHCEVQNVLSLLLFVKQGAQGRAAALQKCIELMSADPVWPHEC